MELVTIASTRAVFWYVEIASMNLPSDMQKPIAFSRHQLRDCYFTGRKSYGILLFREDGLDQIPHGCDTKARVSVTE
jgi:hypothetical protein